LRCAPKCTQSSQNGSTLDSRSRHSTSQQQSRFKSQATHSYGSPAHHATAGKAYNKRLFSRSQPYRESNTPPLNAVADKPVADWPRRQPPQPATPRFSSKEKYSSVHLKGLAADPKDNPQDTSHLAHPPPTTRKEESQV